MAKPTKPRSVLSCLHMACCPLSLGTCWVRAWIKESERKLNVHARVGLPDPRGREEQLSQLAGGTRSGREGGDPASRGEKEDLLDREFLDQQVWPYPMPTGTSSNASAAASIRLNAAARRAWKCFDRKWFTPNGHWLYEHCCRHVPKQCRVFSVTESQTATKEAP